MKPIKSISIPQKCHQSWQQMAPNDKGRYCESCCKTVIDFTAMTDGEIIKVLSLKTNVCGRFEQLQLNSINNKLYAENLTATGWWKRAIIFWGMIGPMAFKAGAQQKTPISYTSHLSTHKKRKTDRLPLLEARSVGVIPTLPATGLFQSTDVEPMSSDYNGTKAIVTSMGSVSVAVRVSRSKRIWYKIKRIF